MSGTGITTKKQGTTVHGGNVYGVYRLGRCIGRVEPVHGRTNHRKISGGRVYAEVGRVGIVNWKAYTPEGNRLMGFRWNRADAIAALVKDVPSED